MLPIENTSFQEKIILKNAREKIVKQIIAPVTANIIRMRINFISEILHKHLSNNYDGLIKQLTANPRKKNRENTLSEAKFVSMG